MSEVPPALVSMRDLSAAAPWMGTEQTISALGNCPLREGNFVSGCWEDTMVS